MNREIGSKVFITNMNQANYFIDNGINPIKLKIEKCVFGALFVRSEQLNDFFDEWVNRKNKK